MLNTKNPFERFFSLEAAGGLALLFSASAALILANSSWGAGVYESILHFPTHLQFSRFVLPHTLHHLVNDGLMVIFFFMAGLEIKRELAVGELSAPKKAALPIFAALGGMAVPALFYWSFNQGEMLKGWGIPMATDIAFAVGALSLMSKRVPLQLKVFLLTLAIVDDLGAVLVIAFFYSQQIISLYLAFSVLTLFFIYGAKKAGVNNLLFYSFCGVGLWFFVLNSGVHATVAGVILGLMTPVEDQHTHADYLIEKLHPFVTWIIVPVFAFFNAGVALGGEFSWGEFASHPVTAGVLTGLVIGKPVGILLFSLLAVRLNMAQLPAGFSLLRLTGVGFLAGIGFTMSLFISHLSFDSAELAMYSKLSILTASVLAMIVGLSLLALAGRAGPSAAGPAGQKTSKHTGKE